MLHAAAGAIAHPYIETYGPTDWHSPDIQSPSPDEDSADKDGGVYLQESKDSADKDGGVYLQESKDSADKDGGVYLQESTEGGQLGSARRKISRC
ncbi:hypothetical protein AAFF_G00184200 [Aldrovandia affinis]|uniref:Uncharacterized protein n=1 Tax=Aldrovandia affinis TaxID=143900 RepID=A0AAD7RK46_9TELE|nr:hypothetical protein AAFF_G00184200 [Aldrovandia affinis]